MLATPLYVANLWFFKKCLDSNLDLAVTSRRVTNLATQPSDLQTPILKYMYGDEDDIAVVEIVSNLTMQMTAWMIL